MPIEKKSKNLSRSFQMKTVLPALDTPANLMTVSSQDASCISDCQAKHYGDPKRFLSCTRGC